MEKCPICGNMTAEKNMYTGQLVCYLRRCGYTEPLPKHGNGKKGEEGNEDIRTTDDGATHNELCLPKGPNFDTE